MSASSQLTRHRSKSHAIGQFHLLVRGVRQTLSSTQGYAAPRATTKSSHSPSLHPCRSRLPVQRTVVSSRQQSGRPQAFWMCASFPYLNPFSIVEIDETARWQA